MRCSASAIACSAAVVRSRIFVVDGHHQRRERRVARRLIRGSGSRRFEAPANTEPAANAIQPRETAKKKIIMPCSSVMLAKRTTCSI